MRSLRRISLAAALVLLPGACTEEEKREPVRAKARARPMPTPTPAPVAEPAPEPEPTPTPTLVPAASNEWWCLCYRREGAEGPEPMTACREQAEQCRKLEQRVSKGSDEIIAGSLTHGCRPIRGSHPSDAVGTHEQWQPSKLRGAWVAERVCLLSEAAPAELPIEPPPAAEPETEVDDFALMKSELIGNIALGDSSAAIRSRHGEPRMTGAIEESPATGSWDQTWTFPDGLTLTMSSSTRSGPQSVSAVTIVSPSTLKTRRGIGIADSREAVERAYGDVRSDDLDVGDDVFVAGSIYGGLVFSFENGLVKEVFLGASAE